MNRLLASGADCISCIFLGGECWKDPEVSHIYKCEGERMQLLCAVRAHSFDGQPALLEWRVQKQDSDNRRLAQFSAELLYPDRMHGLEVLRFQGAKACLLCFVWADASFSFLLLMSISFVPCRPETRRHISCKVQCWKGLLAVVAFLPSDLNQPTEMLLLEGTEPTPWLAGTGSMSGWIVGAFLGTWWCLTVFSAHV